VNKRRLFWLIAAGCFAADRLSKAAALRFVGESGSIPLSRFFSLTCIRNRGICFGLFSGGGARIPVIIGSAAIFLLVVAYVARTERMSTPFLVSLGLVAGGILGNLADRIRSGDVVDFLNFHVWPVFNLADSCIVAGVILAFLSQMRSGHAS